MRFFAALLILLTATTCTSLVPAKTPVQLDHTPGAFISIDEERIHAENFAFSYPQGWRVVKINPAIEPLRFVLVSPDETMLIEVATTPLPQATPAPDATQSADVVFANGQRLYIRGQGEATHADELAAVYAQFRAQFDETP